MLHSLENVYKSPAGYNALQAHYERNLRRWPVPYESRYVTTRHGLTHVLAAGAQDAPPLIVFHGWGSSASQMYREFDLQALTRDYRVYCPDVIGQTGRSAFSRPSTRGNAYALWMSDVLDGLNVEQTLVAGISGGGFIALKFAAYFSPRVRKVMALCPAGLTLHLPHPRFVRDIIPALIWPTRDNIRRFTRHSSAPNAPRNFRHEEMAAAVELTFRHHVSQLGPFPMSDRELRAISAPVYVLMGAHDIVCHTEKSAARARLIPNVTLEILPDAGHVVTMDCPDVVQERLMGFLAV